MGGRGFVSALENHSTICLCERPHPLCRTRRELTSCAGACPRHLAAARARSQHAQGVPVCRGCVHVACVLQSSDQGVPSAVGASTWRGHHIGWGSCRQ